MDDGFDLDMGFLDFEDDEFTEAALRRISNIVEARGTRNRTEVEAVNIRECKLFVGVQSVENIPLPTGCLGVFDRYYTCEVEVMKVKASHLLHPILPTNSSTTTTTEYVPSEDKYSSPKSWDLAEYFGQTKVTFTVKMRNIFKCVTVGYKSMMLSELLELQKHHFLNVDEASSQSSWSVPLTIRIVTSQQEVIPTANTRVITTSSLLKTAKSATTSFSANSSAGDDPLGEVMTPPASQSQKQVEYEKVPINSNNESIHHMQRKKDILVKVEFRLITLQNCLQLCVPRSTQDTGNRLEASHNQCMNSTSPGIQTPSGGDSNPRSGSYIRHVNYPNEEESSRNIHTLEQESELHALVAHAPSHVVVEVMRGLARKKALDRALSLRSPRGCILDEALLSGQAANVLEILQRCGGSSFHITAGQSCPVHSAVRGGSLLCTEYLCRYLKKYGWKSVSGPGATQWNSCFTAKLDWLDEHGYTPLALACSISGREDIAVYLINLGADLGIANTQQSKCTPLMYACQTGGSKIVSALLAHVKSPRDSGSSNNGNNSPITVLGVSGQSTNNGGDQILAAHLRTNPRSRTVLKNAFNALSCYECEPACKESSIGRQAIHMAAEAGHVDIVLQLIDIGIVVNEADRRGDNVFHISSRHGHRHMLEKLLEVEEKAWKVYETYVRNGHSIDTMHRRPKALIAWNHHGQTPAEIALHEGYPDLALKMAEQATNIYKGFMSRSQSKALSSLLKRIETATCTATTSLPALNSNHNNDPLSTTNPEEKDDSDDDAEEYGTIGSQASKGDGSYNDLIDDQSDAIEYSMALTSLSLKYLADNAVVLDGSTLTSTAAAPPPPPPPPPTSAETMQS